MHRFFYPDLKNTSSGSTVRLDRNEESHLFRILRARPGDTVELMDGHGCAAPATVQADHMLLTGQMAISPVPEKRIHLYLAPPRKQKMDQLLKQAGELGVWRVVPILCDRSVALPSGEDKAEHWLEQLQEACKQSGNRFLPEVVPSMKFKDALPDAQKHCSLHFFGDPSDSVDDKTPLTGDISFFVGPEGGFSPEEDSLLRSMGARPLRIGSWILRVETAAVAGIAVLNTLKSV